MPLAFASLPLVAVVGAILGTALSTTAGASAGSATPADYDAAIYGAAIADGATLYAFNCAVCHGKAAGGLADAKLSFPPEERTCTRCHRPNNRTVQSLSEPVVDNDMFAIGTPPSLVATPAHPQPLALVAEPAALWAYVSATMPRYEPGRQTPAEYWLLTAYLLDLNGRSGAAAEAVANAVVAPVTKQP